MTTKYVILASSDLSSVDFSKIEDTGASSLRYNLDSTSFIVEYAVGSKPSFLTGKASYTQSEITAITSDESNGWIPSE